MSIGGYSDHSWRCSKFYNVLHTQILYRKLVNLKFSLIRVKICTPPLIRVKIELVVGFFSVAGNAKAWNDLSRDDPASAKSQCVD